MQTNLYQERTPKHRGTFTERRAFQLVTEGVRKERRAAARANRARKTAFIVASILWSDNDSAEG